MITEEQKIERMKGIGGSDMPIILGLSSYKTPYQLYLEKKGLLEPNFEESPLQYWGNQLESIIRREFQKRNKVRVKLVRDTIIHPFYDFLRGHLDGFIPKWNAVLEVKCSHQFMAQKWGEPGTDIVPMEYLVQVAFYCSLINAPQARIAVLIGGNEYREFKYMRDLDLEKTIIDAACGFWDAVQKETPPPAYNHGDLKLMYPRHNGTKKSINQDIMKSFTELKEIKLKLKELEAIEQAAKFQIMNYMQDAECLVNENDEPLVTWKENKKGSRTFLLKGV